MAPILFPVAMKLGIDPVHFGIIMVVNMEVGMCHPPVGLNLYVASGITKMGITELTVAVWPWLLTMLVFLVLVTYWPPLSLWLPQALGHDVADAAAQVPRRHGALPRARPQRPGSCACNRAIGADRDARPVGAIPPCDGRTKPARYRVIILNLLEFHSVGDASMAVERTLSIIKPDAVAKNVIGKIYSRFETHGPQDRRRAHGAGCRAPKPKASTPCIANGRSSRTWSSS